MRYIDQWLSGLGLDHVIPLLQAHGITTPKKLALLSLRDIYEVGRLCDCFSIGGLCRVYVVRGCINLYVFFQWELKIRKIGRSCTF
jgi:hypothetical protein